MKARVRVNPIIPIGPNAGYIRSREKSKPHPSSHKNINNGGGPRTPDPDQSKNPKLLTNRSGAGHLVSHLFDCSHKGKRKTGGKRDCGGGWKRLPETNQLLCAWIGTNCRRCAYL
ncbi:hypothetical protein PoB_003460700 [Plakobranchus ocellatus]|uniref:Uncharacterized protein n=1 Tax=Plakobranchus ocellatus TaxID=259542 RepID=A0AAV4AM99_9GAST|nr:hypothetical protein PoB_003460700 [Plakobranchus ocellatus]